MSPGEAQVENKQQPPAEAGAATAPAPAPAPKPPRRRHRVRKWLARFAAVVLGLLLLIAIVIQIALFTGLPKQIVVGQVDLGLSRRLVPPSR